MRTNLKWKAKNYFRFVWRQINADLYLHGRRHTHMYICMCIRYTNLCLAIKLILMPHASTLRVSYFLVSLEKAIRKLEQELSARQDLSMAGNKSICSIAKWALSQLASRKTFVTQLSCNLQRATCNTLMCQQQDSSATTFYASAAADVQPDVSLDVSPMSSFPKYSPRSICVL